MIELTVDRVSDANCTYSDWTPPDSTYQELCQLQVILNVTAWAYLQSEVHKRSINVLPFLEESYFYRWTPNRTSKPMSPSTLFLQFWTWSPRGPTIVGLVTDLTVDRISQFVLTHILFNQTVLRLSDSSHIECYILKSIEEVSIYQPFLEDLKTIPSQDPSPSLLWSKTAPHIWHTFSPPLWGATFEPHGHPVHPLSASSTCFFSVSGPSTEKKQPRYTMKGLPAWKYD